MNFWSECKKNFSMYGQFSGRGSKQEYRAILLPYMLLLIVARVITATHATSNGVLQLSGGVKWLYGMDVLLLVLLFIPQLAATFRRAHDAGRSGWWIWVPFYNYILLFKDSDPNANIYGASIAGDGWSAGEISTEG